MFNALALRPEGSGIHRYAAELMAALPGVVRARMLAVVLPEMVAAVPAGVEAIPRHGSRGIARFAAGARSLPQGHLVHGLNVAVPRRKVAPTVASVHDLSVYDMPAAFRRPYLMAERAAMRNAVAKADVLMAISAFTAERLHDRFKREAIVVHLAPGRGFGPVADETVVAVRSSYGLPDDFALFVGAQDGRKDVSALAEACRNLSLPLAIAGPAHRQMPAGARHLGYVPDADLPGLYGAATVVGYPSMYEGFGLPPLEAMACGAAVVAYRIPPLVEVLGDAASLVRPHDVEALTGAIRRLLADPEERAGLVVAGRRRAGSFTWLATAQATAEVYRGLGVSC